MKGASVKYIANNFGYYLKPIECKRPVIGISFRFNYFLTII